MATIYKTHGEAIFQGDNGMASWLLTTREERRQIAQAVIAGDYITNDSADADPVSEWDLVKLGAKPMTAEEIRHRYLGGE